MAKQPNNPFHPGEILIEEFLEPMGMTQAEFARQLGWTKARLNELIRGKRGITAGSALDLADALGTSAKTVDESSGNPMISIEQFPREMWRNLTSLETCLDVPNGKRTTMRLLFRELQQEPVCFSSHAGIEYVLGIIVVGIGQQITLVNELQTRCGSAFNHNRFINAVRRATRFSR